MEFSSKRLVKSISWCLQFVVIIRYWVSSDQSSSCIYRTSSRPFLSLSRRFHSNHRSWFNAFAIHIVSWPRCGTWNTLSIHIVSSFFSWWRTSVFCLFCDCRNLNFGIYCIICFFHASFLFSSSSRTCGFTLSTTCSWWYCIFTITLLFIRLTFSANCNFNNSRCSRSYRSYRYSPTGPSLSFWWICFTTTIFIVLKGKFLLHNNIYCTWGDLISNNFRSFLFFLPNLVFVFKCVV